MTVIIIRTLLVYAIVTAAVRVMGKRQVSDMQTSELVITLIISEVASLPLENADRPLLVSLVPILILAAIEILVSLLMLKSKRARGIICGHPVVIIKDGQLIDSEMRRLRISYEDVYSLLRQQNYPDPAGVKFGIIEPNGSLSVMEDKDLSRDGIRSAELRDALDKAAQGQPESAAEAQPAAPQYDTSGTDTQPSGAPQGSAAAQPANADTADTQEDTDDGAGQQTDSRKAPASKGSRKKKMKGRR